MSKQFGDVVLSYFILFALSLAGGILIEYIFQGLQVFKTKTIQNKKKCICQCRRMKPLVKNVALPSLLGMMIFPLVAYNIHQDIFNDGFSSKANSLIRQGTFGLVLFKAGLGLDLRQIKRFASTLAMLILIPSFAEAILGVLFSVFLFDMPVTLAFGFGYLLTGTSTSIIIPLSNNFEQQGIGTNKQIPSLLILGSTIEAILALIIIQFMVSLQYSGDTIFGESSGAAAGLGFFEVFAAIIIGVLVALIFKLIFQSCRKFQVGQKLEEVQNQNKQQNQVNDQVQQQQLQEERGGVQQTTNRQIQLIKTQATDIVQFTLMLSTCVTALFVPTLLWEMGNFGYIFTVVMTSSLRLFWKGEIKKHKIKLYNQITGQLWRFGKYWLYGLIGTTIDVSNLEKGTVGYLVLIVILGMVVKIPITILSLSCKSKFIVKERTAIAFIWIAKATVQVALGGLVKERQQNLPPGDTRYGQKFATMSVLAILFCASFGAAFGNIFGRKWFYSQNTQISPQEVN